MISSNRRRWLLAGGAGAVLAALGAGAYRYIHPSSPPIGFDVEPAALERARALLRRHVSIDAHAHPGRSFVRGAEHLSGLVWVYAKLGHFEAQTVAAMAEGGLSAAAFAAVADFQTLGTAGEGLAVRREFNAGEAWASYKRQITYLRALGSSGLVYPINTPADIEGARAAGKVGALLTVEGGDFLEGKPERVVEAFSDGVRSITLLHYRNNELGDTITGAPLHSKLTDAGIAVVRTMNRIGMLIDVAHASQATAMGVVEATSQPIMASHVHVQSKSLSHPRFISEELARAVAQTGGGVLGAWPAGIGISDLRGFIDRTFELIDVVGIDHVCLGTDMDANYKPVFDTYTKLPYYVAGLLQHGLNEADVAKVIGGNFLRVFTAVQRTSG